MREDEPRRQYLASRKERLFTFSISNWITDLLMVFLYSLTLGILGFMLVEGLQGSVVVIALVLVLATVVNVFAVIYLGRVICSALFLLMATVSITAFWGVFFGFLGRHGWAIPSWTGGYGVFSAYVLGLVFLLSVLLLVRIPVIGLLAGFIPGLLMSAADMPGIYLHIAFFFFCLAYFLLPKDTRLRPYLTPGPRVKPLRREDKVYLKQDGMTLIELLIVLAIIGIMAGGAMRVLGHIHVTEEHLDGIGRASAIASSEMEALIAMGFPAGDLKAEMDLPIPPDELDNLHGVRGKVFAKAETLHDLAEVTVTVHWTTRTGEQNFSLTRLIGRATQ